jgi:hypothetical protein
MEKYSLELYRFAWGTIRARAFGRRLPWSALVPLADCLNHGNVPTKYDFDAGGSQTFRYQALIAHAILLHELMFSLLLRMISSWLIVELAQNTRCSKLRSH